MLVLMKTQLSIFGLACPRLIKVSKSEYSMENAWLLSLQIIVFLTVEHGHAGLQQTQKMKYVSIIVALVH